MRISSDSGNDIFLPGDIVFRILLFLPVRSLLLFKSVSKSWRDFIDSPAFIDQHLHLHNDSPSSHDNNCNSLMVLPPGDSPIRTQRSFSCDLFMVPGDKFEVPLVKLEIDFHEFVHGDIDLVTCNGIVCLQTRQLALDSSKSLVSLWNPATKKLRTLRQSPFRLGDEHYPGISIGFGFDLKSNGYKVVRIISSWVNPLQVEIYSANTGSWRIIDSVVPADTIISNPRVPFQNGTYCWMGRKNGVGFFIVSFDFSKEVFGTMSLPDTDIFTHGCPHLEVVKDNLACINGVAVYYFETYNVPLEIWMLNEYGVKESWTRLYKIEPFPYHRIIRLSENGSLLILVHFYDRQLCMYDLVTQELKNLATQRLPEIHFIKVAPYRESLVPVELGNGAVSCLACRRLKPEQPFAAHYL